MIGCSAWITLLVLVAPGTSAEAESGQTLSEAGSHAALQSLLNHPDKAIRDAAKEAIDAQAPPATQSASVNPAGKISTAAQELMRKAEKQDPRTQGKMVTDDPQDDERKDDPDDLKESILLENEDFDEEKEYDEQGEVSDTESGSNRRRGKTCVYRGIGTSASAQANAVANPEGPATGSPTGDVANLNTCFQYCDDSTDCQSFVSCNEDGQWKCYYKTQAQCLASSTSCSIGTKSGNGPGTAQDGRRRNVGATPGNGGTNRMCMTYYRVDGNDCRRRTGTMR